jgi:NADPH:quinone reductase-like Zn-dependent oxidoreductase
MTAEFLLHTVHPLNAGETVLIYAPAGGVGRLLCQWASHLGAIVIGATSSEEKARVARASGARHVILPGERSLEKQVRDLTEGRGVDVVYDAVGRDSFAHSVAALAPRGHLVSYGQASGDIGTYDIGALAINSVTLSRPNYGHYTDTRDKVEKMSKRLFDAIEQCILSIEVNHRFALEQASEAHRALEGRRTTGSIVLIPEE